MSFKTVYCPKGLIYIIQYFFIFLLRLPYPKSMDDRPPCLDLQPRKNIRSNLTEYCRPVILCPSRLDQLSLLCDHKHFKRSV